MARPPTLLMLALACPALAPGCSSDGETPDCPPLRTYDVNNAQSRADARDGIQASAAKGCITLPAGFAAGDGDGAGDGGGGGRDGAAGAGGSS